MISIYNAARSHEFNRDLNGISSVIDKTTIAAFKAGAAFVQRWIPIEEEKPTSQGHYLVKCKNSFPKNCDVVVAEFYEDNHVFYSESSDCPIHDVTHWRPISFS